MGGPASAVLAGVDMTSAQPFDVTMKKMSAVMDEMENLLTKMKR